MKINFIFQDNNQTISWHHSKMKQINNKVLLPTFIFITFIFHAIPAWPSAALDSYGPPENQSQNANVINIDELLLEQALGFVLSGNPLLRRLESEISALNGTVIQVGLLPNPEIGTEIENFAGQGDMKGFDKAETTIYLSQLIETGSKRDKRHRIALSEKDSAIKDYEIAKLELMAATSKAFINVLSAQELYELDKALVRIAEKTAAAIEERVAAGKVSPVEKTRTLIELAAARNEAIQAHRELRAAKEELSSYWGSKQVFFDRAVGNLELIKEPQSQDKLIKMLNNSPYIAKWDSEIAKKRAELELARAKSIPDISLSAGVRNFQETDDTAFVFGITIPIPVFDRNQGGVMEAVARLESARHRKHATRISLKARILSGLQRLRAAYSQASVLKKEIMPQAQAAYQATEQGYVEGKFNLMQLLDAQRTLFKVKRQYIAALKNYHLIRIDIEGLTGIIGLKAGNNLGGNDD